MNQLHGGASDQELKRNGSGYYDPTAYKALRNIEREVERMDCKRGEIFEFTTSRGDLRKVLIISDDARRYSRNLTGILLNEESKGEYGVQIVCGGKMYAECDRVSHIRADSIGNYIRTATDEEMCNVDDAVMDALGLKAERDVYKELYEKLLERMGA